MSPNANDGCVRVTRTMHPALWGHEEWLFDGRTLQATCPGFSLLVKKICAKQRLSVQVHPNDVTAKTVGGDPKTEMWYVLEPGPIFAGFRAGVTAADVERAVADGSFEDLLVRFDATRGECYFIPGGLVHAIGEGTSVYEVQQASDTTFRLYDWGRVDASGKPRTLHVKEALAAMDLTLPPPVPSSAVRCPYFTFEPVSAGTLEASDLCRAVYGVVSDEALLVPPGVSATLAVESLVTACPVPCAPETQLRPTEPCVCR